MLEIDIETLTYKLNKKEKAKFYKIFSEATLNAGDHQKYFSDKQDILRKFVYSIIKENSELKNYLVVKEL